jgi:hypothetical protein
MITLIANSVGKKRMVISIPNFIIRIIALLVWGYFSLRKKEFGLNPFYFVTTQCTETFLDTASSMEKLTYSHADMQSSINETVKACNF